MSQKDLQFIERALAHPWMFWVYFWKWPRIVRQACAEYDLLAKERDAAKAAHERSERANKIVRDWIHVTHRLSTTPEAIRAIFAAGKRLSILLVFFVVTNTYGQAPPYLRNQWDTNANPLALKVISTNGVHAATNVWELDFTNTATVTVSAVSNANKVMVSFTGSASSGSSSLTNALLHAGPTNGSVDALILTAGNGVTLTTSGTNFVVGASNSVITWTNFSTADSEGGFIVGLRDVNLIDQSASFGMNFLTNFYTLKSSIVSIGYTSGSVTDGVTSASVLNLADLAGKHQTLLKSKKVVNIGHSAGITQRITNGFEIVNLGGLAGQNQKITNFSLVFNAGPGAGNNQVIQGSGASVLNVGNDAGASQSITNAIGIMNFGRLAGNAELITRGNTILNLGSSAGESQALMDSVRILNIGHSAGFQQTRNTSTNMTAFGYKASGNSVCTNCNDIYTFGSFAGTNLVLTGASNIMLFGNLKGSAPVSEEFWFGNTNNVYRMPGNIGTIRGVSGYSWPTAHAAGVWTNDGTGVTGWKPLSDFGGAQTPWTNFTGVDAEGQMLYGSALSNILATPASFAVSHLTNYWGDPSTVLFLGFIDGVNVPAIASTNFGIIGFGDQVFRNATLRGSSSISLIGQGSGTGGSFINSSTISAIGPSMLGSVLMTNSSRSFFLGFGALNSATVVNSDRITGLGPGVFSSGSARLYDADFIDALGTEAFLAASLTNCTYISGIGHHTFREARLTNCHQIAAFGPYAGTNLSLTAKTNVIFFGNVGTVTPVNNEFWFGSTNNTSRFPGNVVIRSATAPTVGQILTATDTSGTVGWSNAPSVSLTPWASDIDAAAFSLTNFNQLRLTNGARIEQPTATITRFTNSTFDFGGNMTFTPDGTYSVGTGTKRPLHFDIAGAFTAGDSVRAFGSLLLGNNGGLTTIADGSAYLRNNAATDWGRLAFGGSTAAFPALKRNSGHLAVVDAAGSNSTNSLFFGNTVDTTASTGMTMNRQTGRVRLSAGNQTYLVTNNLATANSIVTATVNSDDSTALNVKAIPAAGLITLKANAATTADTDISFFISAP